MKAANPRATAISSNTTHMLRSRLLAATACALSACTPIKPAPPAFPARYEAASFESLPGWRDAALEPSLRAFLRGCPRADHAAALMAACKEAGALDPTNESALRAFLERVFVPYRIVAEGREAGRDHGLITGYYEPVIAGSRMRTTEFAHPLYGLPEDLVAVDLADVYPELRHMRLRGRLEGRRLVPYASRAEIESGRVVPPAPVIAWVSDPVELFFLHVQGSGQIRYADGTRVRVGYAEQNGHPYRSLGRYLVDRGDLSLEEASMDGIKSWAAAHPDKLRQALDSNPSYVFFRQLTADDGPIGALGVPLTAGYSLAVDRRYIPLGSLVYLSTTEPLQVQPLERLLAAQDTGGAIRGAMRADFYWGSGAEAGLRAGRMRQQGRLWLLWPRNAALPAPG